MKPCCPRPEAWHPAPARREHFHAYHAGMVAPGLLSANARHPHVAVPHGMTKEVSFLEQLARPTINCSRNFKFRRRD